MTDIQTITLELLKLQLDKYPGLREQKSFDAVVDSAAYMAKRLIDQTKPKRGRPPKDPK